MCRAMNARKEGVRGWGQQTVWTIVKRSVRIKTKKWSWGLWIRQSTFLAYVEGKSYIIGGWVEEEKALASGDNRVRVMFDCDFSRWGGNESNCW